MGYLHIENLYKSQTILMFRECFALEKIHGTSANVAWCSHPSNPTTLTFHSGGEKHNRFVKLFDHDALSGAFRALGHEAVTVFGEAYGGSQQGMRLRYGDALRFVAFDVMVGDSWLSVPQAADVVAKIGLEFVHYARVSTDVAALDAERDAPSEQARRNGIEGVQHREGVVLRPLIELRDNRGERIISKHKRDDERETATSRKVADPSKLAVLTRANEIADEWVTTTRLTHVLDRLGDVGIERTRDVIAAMIDDVVREGAGEFVDSKEARAAIGRKAAEVFRTQLRSRLGATDGGAA